MRNVSDLRKIATGSAVDAFLAKSSEGHVLVQVSHPEVIADPELYGRFLDVSRLTATQHRHPALLAPEHTQCEADGRFISVTGPVSGRTAADYLREYGPLDTAEAVRWGIHICDALEFLHSLGVVHGYLAPHNLFLDGDSVHPDVRLLDTALLLFRGTKSVPRHYALVAPEYLSPERCAGNRGTPSCDVYGMGVLLYELLTRTPPFSGDGVKQTKELQLEAPLPPLRPGLEEWEPVFARCLAKRAGDRYHSPAELREVLRGLRPLTTPGVEVQTVQGEQLNTGPEALGPGDVLGRYRIDALIGEGGMGQVFEATHLSISRKVAIKVLRPEFSRVESQVQRFVTEAQAVNRVKHPNIVSVEDLIQEEGRVYFVMELLHGPSLKLLARDTPIDLKRALGLMRQAAHALSAAHGVGVIHRDLKPDNMMVETDAAGSDLLKVLDFGVARVRGIDVQDSYRTQVGQVVGTPLWMAPEQVLGHQVDARADIYSLSMVLYALLSRRFPFPGPELSKLVIQRLSIDAAPIGETSFLGEPLPKALQQLLEKGLSRDLAKRPESMDAFAASLQKIEDKLESAQAPEGRVNRPSWWSRFRS